MALLAELTPVDWLGVLGSLLIAFAYLGVSMGWLAAERPGYHLWNLGGAGLILLSLWYRPNAGAIVIEVLWLGIAVVSLARHYRNRR